MRSAGGEPRQGVAGEPLHGPFVHAGGSDGAVEADGGLVPVEDRPFEAAVAPLRASLGEGLQQRPAVAVAPFGLTDEKVLEVDAVAPGPRGVVQEPDRDRDDLPAFLDHVREHGRRRLEEGLAQVVRCRLYRVRLFLVPRQPADTVQDPVFVATARPPQDSTVAQRLLFIHRRDPIRRALGPNPAEDYVCPSALGWRRRLWRAGARSRNWSSTGSRALGW